MGNASGVPNEIQSALKRELRKATLKAHNTLWQRLHCAVAGHKYGEFNYFHDGSAGVYVGNITCKRCSCLGAAGVITAVSSYAVAARSAQIDAISKVCDTKRETAQCDAIPHCSSGVGCVLAPPLQPRHCMEYSDRCN